MRLMREDEYEPLLMNNEFGPLPNKGLPVKRVEAIQSAVAAESRAAGLLSRLQSDSDLIDELTADGDDWIYDCENDTPWRRDVKIYGVPVTIYAEPCRQPGTVSPGEIVRLEVVG